MRAGDNSSPVEDSRMVLTHPGASHHASQKGN